MKNEYKILNDRVIIYAYRKGAYVEILVDKENFDLVSNIPGTWSVKVSNSGKLYAVTHKPVYIEMHKLILPDIPEGSVRDHSNRNSLDNRKNNLEAVTQMINMQNQGKRLNNKSGIKGVSWHKLKKKWVAQVDAMGYHRYLGAYDCKYEAGRVANAYRLEMGIPAERTPITIGHHH